LTGPIAPGPGGSPPLLKSTDAKKAPSHHEVDPDIQAAAQGFEAMFLDQMMKTMRQTVPKNELDLEDKATEVYRGMLDSEYSEKAAKAGGVGLADQIVAYLEAQRYPLPRGSADSQEARQRTAGTTTLADRPNEPVRDTGGTYEGHPDQR
jgi:flagellar protein FlgJ